jgi:hypothetical protein
MSIIKDKSSYTSGEKAAVVRLITQSEEWGEIQAKKRQRISRELMSLARLASGGADNKTIRNWLTTDISEDAENKRLSERGRKRKWSKRFLGLLAGYAIARRLDLKAVSAQDLIEWALGYFNYIISQQRISEIMWEYGFSSQLALARNSRMTDEQVADDCVDFILDVRQLLKIWKRMWFMDETGLWSNNIQRQTYHFRNQYETPLY